VCVEDLERAAHADIHETVGHRRCAEGELVGAV
jgi:hypothetical protein